MRMYSEAMLMIFVHALYHALKNQYMNSTRILSNETHFTLNFIIHSGFEVAVCGHGPRSSATKNRP